MLLRGGVRADRSSNDPLLNTAVSASDREVMQINGIERDDSLTERVGRLVATADVTSGGASPLTAAGKPFSAFGHVQSLLSSQLQKVSSSRFDDSPDKRHDVTDGTRASARGIAAAYSNVTPTASSQPQLRR